MPTEQRGSLTAERRGMHDIANLRTEFHSFGMIGDYALDPTNVDLSVFHLVEVPKAAV